MVGAQEVRLRVLAAGRASEILDLGDGTVLRRFTRGGDAQAEAAVMGLARRHGYRVPMVHAVRPDGLVLERITGPTMADDLAHKPWRMPGHARMLAQLHNDLHAIEMPKGGVLLHLDLHPKNVLLSRSGPVVIDWANARAGEAGLDTALTWVILMTSSGPTRRWQSHEHRSRQADSYGLSRSSRPRARPGRAGKRGRAMSSSSRIEPSYRG
jgi:tRNA A-37 threonylcarbamoyl transferase component Bud32